MNQTLPLLKLPLRKRLYIPFDGQKIIIDYDEQVYVPTSHSTVLEINNFSVYDGDKLGVVIGTGSGLDAIAMTKKGMPKVIATDIDPYSLSVARHNAEINQVLDKMEFILGNMFDPLIAYKEKGEKFDLIMSNPPCMPVPEELSYKYPVSLNGGPDGTKYLEIVLNEAKKYLHETNGRLYFNFGSTSNPKKLFSILDTLYSWKEIARIKIPFTEQFLLLWNYLIRQRDKGIAEFWEEHGVPFRWYVVIEARPK